MAIEILTLPGSSGKTTWVVDQVTSAGLDLLGQIRVVVPSRLQVADLEKRLARAGGSLGVKLGTLGDLAAEILERGGRYPLLLPETVQTKVMGSVLGGLDLPHYQAITDRPGFVRACLDVIRELKAGGIRPDQFSQAIETSGIGPRLSELGLIYSAYLGWQQDRGWSDRAGLAWLAADLLIENPDLCGDWGRIYLDGFDDLTPVQFQMISSLAERIDRLVITLTGTADGQGRELVHKRFNRLREQLTTLDAAEIAVPPWSGLEGDSPARLLEERLFLDSLPAQSSPGSEISLVAVPDREAEVRTALRWVKAQILAGELLPGRAAVLARNLEPYRGLLARVAAEYSLPIHLPGGLPLSENPLIAALLKLARVTAQGKEGLAFHDVLSLWRSPYLDWGDLTASSDPDRWAAHLQDTNQLEELVQWGRVVRGYGQWEEAFRALIAEAQKGDGPSAQAGPPRGDRAEELWEKFSLFVDLLTPPGTSASKLEYISWFENLLGGLDPEGGEGAGLGVVGQVLDGPQDTAERDWQALAELNRIFKELIWAERLLESPGVTFAQFLLELEEIVGRTSYQPRGQRGDGVICAGCTEVRGLHFQAVAVLGLAEGEFPAAIKEDPFIRDNERLILQEGSGLPLRLSVDSAEGEYFYEALTRAEESLLLTRPRIAENGALWKQSPYWEEALRITQVEPAVRTTRSEIPLKLAANQAELLEIISARGGLPPGALDQIAPELNQLAQSVARARDILRQRGSWRGDSPTAANGFLGERSGQIAERYPEDHVWSASRLESYQTCPFNYFIGYLLGLELVEPPAEGLDARQLGTIYHEILEKLYRRAAKDYRIQDLLDLLPSVAEPILREAPRQEGFRETAWWEHTQREILENLKLCLIKLEELDPQFRFFAAEKRFGIRPNQEAPLTVEVRGGGRYLLRGFIDRVDINHQGEIRVIDYKTSGRSGYDNRAVRTGTKLQLPLYALAAQEELGLGRVKEGFYFHLLAAEPSTFKLSTYKEEGGKGPGAALERAAENGWGAVVSIKEGAFTPQAPDGGCPGYCPAAGFCWAYRPARW